jgi:hypothetical protein
LPSSSGGSSPFGAGNWNFSNEPNALKNGDTATAALAQKIEAG